MPCRRPGCSWGAGPGSCVHGRNASWCEGRRAWRRSGHKRRSTPASSMVTNVCRSMRGCIRGSLMFTAAASRRSRRVAACRSIRAPRRFNRRGPSVPARHHRIAGLPDHPRCGNTGLFWVALLGANAQPGSGCPNDVAAWPQTGHSLTRYRWVSGRVSNAHLAGKLASFQAASTLIS